MDILVSSGKLLGSADILVFPPHRHIYEEIYSAAYLQCKAPLMHAVLLNDDISVFLEKVVFKRLPRNDIWRFASSTLNFETILHLGPATLSFSRPLLLSFHILLVFDYCLWTTGCSGSAQRNLLSLVSPEHSRLQT